MFANLFKRFRRAPLPALAVAVLAMVLAAALCGLDAANTTQQLKYEEMRRTVPVNLQVTNLSATRRDGLECPRWVHNAFTGMGLKEERSLAQYVKDVQCKMSYYVGAVNVLGTDVDLTVVGITSPNAAPDLAQRQTGIQWFDGYDESVLQTDQFVCLIPRNLLPEDYDGSAPLEFSFHTEYGDGFSAPGAADHTLTVVGTHSAGEELVYCPYQAVRKIYTSVSRTVELDAVSATLVDNELLEEFRERSKIWFAEPNATGERTSWDYSYYFWYPYALEIDTSLLDRAELTLKAGLLLNQLCAYLVFLLSAGAGFFIGFLMIRQRKREISLMRTMGTPPSTVFFSYALEQVVCVVVGAAIGGAPFLWQPAQRLGWFLALYFVGLAVALLIFLHKNLISATKEGE